MSQRLQEPWRAADSERHRHTSVHFKNELRPPKSRA
jgi:hypothetical protein